LEHAQSALILLQEELFSGAMSGGDGNNGVAQKVDRIAVLAIAYHNIGVEQEFLKRHEQSLHSYRKGVDIAETHLGNDHGITITLRNSHIVSWKLHWYIYIMFAYQVVKYDIEPTILYIISIHNIQFILTI